MSDAAIMALVTGTITIVGLVVGFLTMWIKLKYGVDKVEETATKVMAVEKKVDDNTVLTRAGAKEVTSHAIIAVNTAKAAAETAADAKIATEELTKQLNGALDERIHNIIKAYIDPLTTVVSNHAEADERNMSEVRIALQDFVSNIKLKELSDYVHKSNHNTIDAINAQSLKLDVLLTTRSPNSERKI